MFRLTVSYRVFAALFLLNLLFAGCDRKSPSSQQESLPTAVQQSPTPTVSEQPKFPSTPQKACGDALPKDTNAYPVNLYPVFIDYSEKNLELVKQHFCEDALKKFRDKTGKDTIQVASFTSQGKASQFKEKLAKHFNGANVGSPTIVEAPNKAISKEGVSKTANLTSDQFAQLRKIVGLEKDFETHDVVVLPTDVPDGFKIAHFLTWRQTLGRVIN